MQGERTALIHVAAATGSSFFSSLAAALGTNSFAFGSGLKLTLLCGLLTALWNDGVGTATMGVLVPSPRWNVPGRTRPGGCANVQLERVQAAPKRHCTVDCECECEGDEEWECAGG